MYWYPHAGVTPPPELYGTSTMAALRVLLGGRGNGRGPAFEPAEGSGCATGLLDGPLALAAALLAAGGPAAEPGQAVIRTNVGNLSMDLLRAAAAVNWMQLPVLIVDCASAWPCSIGCTFCSQAAEQSALCTAPAPAATAGRLLWLQAHVNVAIWR